MIDNRKIEEATERQLNNLGSYGLNEDELDKIGSMVLYREEDVKESFKAAINWFLNNLWHDASEEPKDKSAILFRYTGPMCKWASLDKVDADDWKQTVKELGITRWLYIDDLFPKEGGE